MSPRKPRDAGMVPEQEWEQTNVHKHSRYWCSKCGQEFKSPHAVYHHLDAEHPKKKADRGWKEDA